MNEKICLIIFSRLQSYGGGRETWLNNFFPEIKRNNSSLDIEVFYIEDSYSEKEFLIPQILEDNISFKKIKLPSGRSKILSLFRLMLFSFFVVKSILCEKKFKKLKIISVGSFPDSIPAFLLKILCGNKIYSICWLRGILSKEVSHRHNKFIMKILQKIELVLIEKNDFVISNGYDTKNFYFRYGIDSFVIPNGVNIEIYRRIPYLRTDCSPKIIAYIGRISKEKGIEDFLNSVKLFNSVYSKKLFDKIDFHVVGEGPLVDLVRKEEALHENLYYIGPIKNKEIPNYLEKIFAGVALTYSGPNLGGGGVSNGLLELMAAGRGIICWDSNVFGQVLDSKSAFMVPEGDCELLAKVFYMIFKNPSGVLLKGKCARKVAEKYSMKNHVKKFLDVLKISG